MTERISSPSARITGSRRHVILMFSDLCASTSLADRIDPEDLADALRQLKAMADRVVMDHGGLPNQFYGDGVLAVFGLVDPQEDDARRAIEAALDLHEKVRTGRLGDAVPTEFPTELHTGIHGGVVYTARGDETQGRYRLVGDTVHVAARLSSMAGSDEILVSEKTLRSVRAFFDAEDRGALSLRGISDAVHAFRVRARTSVATRFEARHKDGLTPFVGRAQQLARLLDAVAQCRRGHLAVLGVVGGAGMGKTRLLRHAAEKLRGTDVRVYYGYCESYGTVGPMQPFRQILRQIFHGASAAKDEREKVRVWFEVHAPRLVHHAPLFAQMLATTAASDEPDLDASTEALGELVRALATERPLVLMIDDWQWVDDASRRMLDATLRALQDRAAVVVTGSRGNDLADPVMSGAPIIELPPLAPEEAASMLRSLLSAATAVGTTERILARCGGHPLFLEELCLSGGAWEEADRAATDESEVPVRLHALIESRIERLADREARTIAIAAVVGTVVPTELLIACGADVSADCVRTLVEADLLSPGDQEGQLRFKHGITRDVVYECVGLRERRELHRTIAATIEERAGADASETLAYHYGAAGIHEDAAMHAEVAGDRALAMSSLYQAIHHYGIAMEHLEQMSQTDARKRKWVSVCLRWATACAYAPTAEQAELLEEALRRCRDMGDRENLARAYFCLGYISYALGAADVAARQFDSGLVVAKELGDENLVAQLELGLGVSYGAQGSYRAAIEYVDSGLATKRRASGQDAPAPTSVGSAYAIACKACVQGDQGRFDLARETFEEALQVLGDRAHAVEGSILGLLIMTLLWQGRWGEALDNARRARALARRANAPYVYAMSEVMGAYAALKLDGQSGTLEQLQRNVDWLEGRGIRLFQSYNCYATLADARCMTGDLAGAQKYAELALGRSSQHDRVGEGLAYRVLARCAAARGQPGEPAAFELLEKALAAARSRGSPWDGAATELALAEHHAGAGRDGEAMALLSRAREAFERMSMPWHLHQTERLSAELSRRRA